MADWETQIARAKAAGFPDPQEEGRQARSELGCGDMADAQRVFHDYAESVYGLWCVLCGLDKDFSMHTEAGR